MIVPYGTATYSPGGLTREVAVERGQPLRLNNSPYQLDDLLSPPRGGTTADMLGFLRDYHLELCDAYAKRQRQFVELYFRFIDLVLAEAKPELEKRAAEFAGLFCWQDYAYSALRPLPQAHLPVGGQHIRTDFAFWTGERLLAVDIESGTRGTAWMAREQHLMDTGIHTLEVPGALLLKNEPSALHGLLPPELASFWRSEALPSSPFKAAALDEIGTAEPEF